MVFSFPYLIQIIFKQMFLVHGGDLYQILQFLVRVFCSNEKGKYSPEIKNWSLTI